MKIQFLSTLPALLLAAHQALADVPGSINYQGRVTVSNVNFNGPGLFKFALVDGGANQNQPATANATVIGGEVSEIFRITMGSGYTEAPVVTITGDGTGATAVASLGGGPGSGTGPTDSVGTITIMDHGSGYTFATINIAPPTPNMVFASFWSNDGTSLAGSEPASAVPINVVNGLYSLAIGDTTLSNMTAELPAVVFDNEDVRLRVWFDDGMHGSQLLTPDQRFATIPYSFRAAFAQTVPAGAITSEHLANGAVSGSKLAAGAVTADRLNVTGSPNSGQVLGFDGANLTWVSAGGGVGGGSLTLPFSGFAASTGSLFSVNNSHPTGPDAWAIYGHSQNSIGVFGQTHGDSSGVLGRAEGAFGQAMYGYASNSATGVLGLSEGGDGIIGVSKIGNHNGVVGRNDEPAPGPGNLNFSGGSGVYGYASQDAVGVQGISEKGDGIFGRTNRANKNAIYGYTDQVNSVGVKGDSANGDGVVGHTDAPNKSGVFAYASRTDNYAAFFSNTGGGKAIATNGKVDVGGDLTVHGLATVRVLTIDNGADVAEPFAIGGGEVLPPGSVVVINGDRPGELRRSGHSYDTRVAGIVSGANGVNTGLSLSQPGVNDGGGQRVALTGRVYCLADASSCSIKPGDLLTTSATPGHAMKATDPSRAQGAVLGKAMSALDKGTGFVLVLVTLQ